MPPHAAARGDGPRGVLPGLIPASPFARAAIAIVLAATSVAQAAGEPTPGAAPDPSLPPVLIKLPAPPTPAPQPTATAPTTPSAPGLPLHLAPLEPAPGGLPGRQPLPSPPALEPVPTAEGTAAAEPPAKPKGSAEDALLTPSVEEGKVAVGQGAGALQPPTPDVRLWTMADTGQLTWQAANSSQEGDWIVLHGLVDIHAGIDRIQADEVRLNEKTHELLAEGNVVLDHLDSRLSGSHMEYDLDTNKGTVYDVLGWTGESYNFTGTRVEKVAEDKYVVYNGTFTSCTQPLPIWRIDANKAIVHVDKFVYMYNPRVFFKRVPAFYLPYAMFPIKQERSTGFMIPRVSQSSVRGLSVQEEFFWAINRSADLTLGGEYWDKYGAQGELTARWHLNGMNSPGYFSAAVLQKFEPDTILCQPINQVQYDVKVDHRKKIWGKWDLGLVGEAASDQLFVKQNTPNDRGARVPLFNQRLTLQRSWGKHSLNFLAENNDTTSTTDNFPDTRFDPSGDFNPPTECVPSQPPPMPPNVLRSQYELKRTTTDQNLPRVEYRASGLQLGGRKWISLSVEGSVARVAKLIREQYDFVYLQPTEVDLRLITPLTTHRYYRADLHPQLSFPFGNGFLQVIPSVNVRGTWWSRVEAGTSPQSDLVQSPTSRTVSWTRNEGLDKGTFLWAPDYGVKIQGPDFERLFKTDAGVGHRKWQHVVSPRIELKVEPTVRYEPLISSDASAGFYHRPAAPHPGPQDCNLDGDTNDRGEQANESCPALPSEKVQFSLVNTFRSKRVVAEGEPDESARDVIIWTLSTDLDLVKPYSGSISDPSGPRTEENRWNNIVSDVNFRPTDRIHFSLRNTVNSLQDDVTDTSLTGGVEGAWGYMDVSVNGQRDPSTLHSRSTQIQATGENWFYKNDRIRLGYDFTKDLELPKWTYRRLVFSYYNQCAGLSLSWEDNGDASLRRDQTWTFIVTLKNVGNYLRYRHANE